MRCSYWLSGTLVLLFAILAQSQGQEACYNVSWTYHIHTHTCFRVFQTGMLWTDARDYCRDNVQAGSDYGVTTQLAKIDDENTNDFVRNLLPNVKWSFWIGLYYNNDKRGFRWDGYPDEEIKFNDSTWEEQSEPYVSLYIDGWKGRDSTRNHHYMCQQSAKRISGNVTCEHHVVANGFNITCTSKRNPIQAKCRWTDKYDEQADQVPQDWTSVATPSHESVEDDGVAFYTTSCKTILSNVQPGNVAFQMKMYPAITEVDLETNEKAWAIGWMNLSVALPNQPLFKTRDETLQTTSPIHFHENNTMDLSCEVTSGKPFVYSVTLSCEFPFNNSDVNNTDTQIGTAYVIDAMTSRDMNGKNCTCIGNHVSGPIESLHLTFNVTYPAEVKNFTVNGQTSLVEVDMDETLTLSCLADGNPMSSVNIWKLEPRYLDTSVWMSNDTESKVEQVSKASCDHNGRYKCSAYNVYNYQEEMQEVDVRVRCPPAYCSETSRDLNVTVRTGRPQTVSLCVIAYPMPVFTLIKNSTTGWAMPEDLNAQIRLVTRYDSQQNVTITFPDLCASHLGKYALNYSVGNSSASSMLYFQLEGNAEEETDGSTGTGRVGPIVGAVVPVVVAIVVVIIVVIFILRRKRMKERQKEDANGDEHQENNVVYGSENYAKVDVSRKKKGAKNTDKTGNEVQIYDNDGFVFNPRSSKDCDGEKDTLDSERPYSNVGFQSNPPDDKTPESKAPESKTPESEDDLVYIQLDFNVTSDKKAKPKKRSKPKKKPKKSEEEEEDGEETEYSAISATATIKIRKEKEEEEKKEKKGKGGDEGKDVYENVTAKDNVP